MCVFGDSNLVACGRSGLATGVIFGGISGNYLRGSKEMQQLVFLNVFNF